MTAEHSNKSYLLTWLGTLLCQDAATRQIVHRPIADLASKADLVTIGEVGSGQALVHEGGRTVPIQVHRYGTTGQVSISDGARFLSAEPNGTAGFSRPRARRWEMFLLLSESDLDALRSIIQARWVQAFGRTIVAAKLMRDFRLQLGEAVFPLSENKPLPFGHRDPETGALLRFSLFRDSWKIDDFVLFRPLVYFTAFGGDEIFSMLRLALTSLDRLGRYSGDVLVITDRSAAEMQAVIPPTLASRTHFVEARATTTLEFCASRYWISGMPEWFGFQPLIYADADVIMDQPIEPILAELVLSPAMTAEEEETSPLERTNSVGAGLCAADGIDVRGRNGFNAGIQGIPNLRDHADTMRKVLETIRRLYAADKRPNVWKGDQPVVNYVAVKTAPFDLGLLSKHVRHTRRGLIQGPREARGFVHFWGSGNRSSERIEAMRCYLEEQLNRQGE